MSILFRCQECDKPLKVRRANAGRQTQCPGCGGIIRIPGPPPEEEVYVAELDESSETRPRPSSKARRRKPSSDDDIYENPVSTRKKKSSKSKKSTSESNAVPAWIIVTACCTMGLVIIGGVAFLATQLKFLPLPGGNKTAQSKEYVQAETDSGNAKFKMMWEMPPGWTQESEIERGLWPWFHMKGQGQSIRLASNRSFTENASTLTSMGGFEERMKAAHTFRTGKLQAENMEHVETTPVVHKTPRNLVVWSDFEYKGLFGKVYGIRCTVPGPQFPCTVTMECSQASRDKWREVLLRIASSIRFKRTKDSDGKPIVENQIEEMPMGDDGADAVGDGQDDAGDAN